jgi:hypothetical protein
MTSSVPPDVCQSKNCFGVMVQDYHETQPGKSGTKKCTVGSLGNSSRLQDAGFRKDSPLCDLRPETCDLSPCLELFPLLTLPSQRCGIVLGQRIGLYGRFKERPSCGRGLGLFEEVKARAGDHRLP